MNVPAAPRIRFAERSDVPRLWEMVRGLAEFERMLDVLSGSAEALADALFGAETSCEALVADDHRRLVGYALVFQTFSSFRTTRGLWLEDLYVAPEARRSGTGRVLLAEVARLALARGCARVRWDVLRWNAPAMAFYQALGGKPDDDACQQFGLEGEALRRLAGHVSGPAR